MRLSAGAQALELDDGLARAATARCSFQNFSSDKPPSLTVRVSALRDASAREFTTAMGAMGRCTSTPSELLFEPPQDAYVAEAAARIAYQQIARSLGGLLVHSSSAHFDGRAVMAVGQSGAGKSTLAKNLVAAGATLLSDEVTMLLPDATVYGTPFRSNVETPGSPGPGRLGLLCLIVHANEERLQPLDAASEISKIVGQVYEPFGASAGATREAFACVAQVIARCGLYAFHCRNSPEAGLFLRKHLDAHG
jgi:hypothetical protein